MWLLLRRIRPLSGPLVAVLNDGVGDHGVDRLFLALDVIDGVIEPDAQLDVQVGFVAEQLVQNLRNSSSIIPSTATHATYC